MHEACAARPRRPAPTLRAAAGAVHALTHANAVCCVLCMGCSAEAGSHSSRPHSSPTLIVQERQSFSHMANGHSSGVDRPQPLANVCKRDLQIPEICYQTCNIKSGPAAFGRLYQLPLLSTSRTATVVCLCRAPPPPQHPPHPTHRGRNGTRPRHTTWRRSRSDRAAPT